MEINDLDAQIIASTDVTIPIKLPSAATPGFFRLTVEKFFARWTVCIFHSTTTFYYYCFAGFICLRRVADPASSRLL